MSAGLVSTEIAEKVAEITQRKDMPELVLVMSEKRLNHANSDKHHETGVGLEPDEYASLSRIVAKPDLIIWDTRRSQENLIYIDKLRSIQVMVRMPNQDKLKPNEKVSGIINAYRVDINDIKREIQAGNMIILKGNL